MNTKICQTRIDDFYIERLEKYPFYERYDEILNAFNANFSSKGISFKSLFAKPVANMEKRVVDWYANSDSEEPILSLKELRETSPEEYERAIEQRDKVLGVLRSTMVSDDTDKLFINCALRHLDCDYIDEVSFSQGDNIIFGVWGMRMLEGRDPAVIITDPAKEHRVHKIHYLVKGKGRIDGQTSIIRRHGRILQGAEDIPTVIPDEHYTFVEWVPEAPQGHKVVADITFTAICEQNDDYLVELKPPESSTIDDNTTLLVKEEPPMRHIHFDAGSNGTLEGNAYYVKKDGDCISKNEIPGVKAKKGYNFIGWNAAPENWTINGDKTFIAQYEQRIPWYKRFWLWFTHLRFPRWLIWLLWTLLVLFLLSLLLRGCGNGAFYDHSGCTRHHSSSIPFPINDKPWVDDIPDSDRHGIYNPGDPYKRHQTPDEYRDILPPEEGVLPPIDTNNIVRDPNRPAVMGNLLNILMENEDKSILDLARAFKEQYPEDKYQIVFYDDVVKRMQIQVPAEEKDRLKAEIPDKFAPEYDLYVYDESLFVIGYTPTDPDFADDGKNWYLKAVNAPAAWDITQGSETLTVAIVDNGFNLNHPELKSKVVMPYNVWTHDNRVYAQAIDHGTHVAGTAVGKIDNGTGLCGIAPKCAFMPVQVSDQNGKITLTSILDGILYALYQGADVVNVSLGLEFPDGMTDDVQQDLQNNYFKEEELLFNEVMRIADRHNAIIVLAAGNQHILAGVDPSKRARNFIVVSAIDKNGDIVDMAPFSNYGEYSTVSAPGVQIYNAFGKNGYTYLEGTSMAAPIVTGAVALMKSLNNDLTAEQAICVLQSTATPVNEKIGPLIQIDKAVAKVQSNDLEDCQGRDTEPMTGDVQLLLSWNDYNDLDLACIDPNGEAIWYKNKHAASGGCLQIDMNVQYGDSKTPIENIYWPTGQAPFGNYSVIVSMYKQHESRTPVSPYHLKVVHGGTVEEYDGTMSKADGKVVVCTFTLGNQGQAPSQGSLPPSRQGQLNPSLPDNGQSNARREELLRQRQILQRQLDKIDDELKTY